MIYDIFWKSDCEFFYRLRLGVELNKVYPPKNIFSSQNLCSPISEKRRLRPLGHALQFYIFLLF